MKKPSETNKMRKAKVTRYFDGDEFQNKERECIFHGFFQYKNKNIADVLAIIEFENGEIQRIDPGYLIFEKEGSI